MTTLYVSVRLRRVSIILQMLDSGDFLAWQCLLGINFIIIHHHYGFTMNKTNHI